MKLNLGCGTKIMGGYINLDMVHYPGVDIIHDINELPLPFNEDTFDEVIMSHILEHIPDYPALMEELYRICKNSAMIIITVPHLAARNAWTDPQHCNFFIERTFHYFTKTDTIEHTPFPNAKWEFILNKTKISFASWWWLKPMEWFANKFTGFYENHLMWIFQPCDIYVELFVVKDIEVPR